MKVKKDRIYIDLWLELKPYNNQVPTDIYYLKLSNKIMQAIHNNTAFFILQKYLSNGDIKMLSCFLTSYFEDIISESKLWNSFVDQHKKLYQKPLPFYNTDEYYEEEINRQDVSFLIWYFINNIQEDQFFIAQNGFIETIAEKVFDVFDEEWDFAPQNKNLLKYYSIGENVTDFYEARQLIDNILLNSWLFYPDTTMRLLEQENEIFEENDMDDPNFMAYLSGNRDSLLHNSHTRLLSIKGKDWAAAVLGENHPLQEDFLKLTKKITALFLYKGQDKKDVFLEHIASGKAFNLTKKSYDHYENLRKIDTILYMGIVQWRNEWWFSGVHSQMEFKEDIVLKEKNSIESIKAVNFLDHAEHNMEEILQKQFIAFKDLTEGAQLYFLNTDEVDEFMWEFTEHCNYLAGHSKKKAKKPRGNEKNTSQDLSDMADDALVFFNPKSGVEVAFGITSAFPTASNPFFNVKESSNDVFSLLSNEDYSKELALYCVEHFADQLPFFYEEEGKEHLEDIDFLLRYWKRANYFSHPSISLKGYS